MARRFVIALDLGSSNVRAHIVPVERPWSPLASASAPYRYQGTRAPANVSRQFDPRDLGARIDRVIAEALASSGADPEDIAAVSVSAQRGGCAFLDAAGQTIYAGPNTDVRAVFQGAAIEESAGERLYQVTGHLPAFMFAPAKLAWFREFHPLKARRVSTVLSLGAWAVHHLTGVAGETAAVLSESGLADFRTGKPDERLLRAMGVSIDLLPPTVAPGDPCGAITREASEATGLRPSTPVVLAGADGHVAALGSGVSEPGEVSIAAGWSAPVTRIEQAPSLDDQRRTWSGMYVVSDRWLLESNPGDTGRAVDAVRRLLGGKMSPERFDLLASAAPEDTRVVTALWGPRALDMSSPGVSLGGLITPTPVTYDGIDPGTIARATLENVAFALRECISVIVDVAGEGWPSIIALNGGMGSSGIFAQLLADVLGVPVRRHGPRAAAAGATVIASTPPADWRHAAAGIAQRGDIVEPRLSMSADLREAYDRWLLIRQRLDALAEEI